MRTTRKLVLVSLVVALLLAATSSSPVGAAPRLRSGTIVSGTGESPANFWVKGMEGCVGAPTCSTWLQSQCSPALAGKNPALHASIVDVADLAGGSRERVFWVQQGVGINWGRYIIQFWTGTKLSSYRWCREMLDARVSGYAYSRFRIPSGARWMTITSSPDNTQIKWNLR
jgi:hypothetical protein